MRPDEWSATVGLRRRKATIEAILALIVLIILCVLLVVFCPPARSDELPNSPVPKDDARIECAEMEALEKTWQEPKLPARHYRPTWETWAHVAALTLDGVTTRQMVKNGYQEIDPLMRPLTGTRPTYSRMIPFAVAEIVGVELLRYKFPRTRWIQRAAIMAHTGAGLSNFRLL